MNILVVADGNFNLKMAQDIIETNIDDSQVFLCSSSEKVIQKIDEYDIDIVLLDIIMPNITGMDLLKNIRSQKKYNDVQIIIFTGITDKESFTLCFEHGANDYINKPIDFTEFIARMKASVKARKNILFLKEQNNIIKEQYHKLQVITQELEENQFNIIQKEKFISLGEIVAGIAHEINNPMGYISSNLATMNNYIEKIKNIVNVYRKFIQLIDEKTITLAKLIQEKNMIDDIERKQKTEFIMDELTTIVLESSEGADRVKKIVRSLQSFGKSSTENEMTYNDLNQIVEDELMLVKNEIQFVAEINRQMEGQLYLLCNREEIGQVILNLLLNAIYAVKKMRPTFLGEITVKTYSSENCVSCQISDTGTGIKEEHLSRIFDPFFTTKDIGDGFGLGLSIAYDIIVKKHRGEFFVNSEVGKGTTFTIKLSRNGSDQ